jgi:hypothetical protein
MTPTLTVDEQVPFVYPAAHEHENASAGTDEAFDDVLDSLHTAPFTHGYEPHSSMSTPQLSPAQPASHIHDHCTTQLTLVVDSPSTQLPPFWHGLLSHSAISKHVVPLSRLAYPGLHWHSLVPGPVWMHCANMASHVSSSGSHTPTSVPQSDTPSQPSAHVHTTAATTSVHVPLFKHGDDAHPSMFTSQLSPVNPRLQLHQYIAAGTSAGASDESRHVPCSHGLDQHSSISSAQTTPVKPAVQLHV